jgi:hypothetical protein
MNGFVCAGKRLLVHFLDHRLSFLLGRSYMNVSRILLHTANLKKIVEEEVPKESVLGD